MAIKLKHNDTFSTYFATFTCVEWISLFEITNGYDMVYKWFSILKSEHNADVVAYVIMPNHLLVILHFHDAKFDLNTIIANGKRSMAYEIINRLEEAVEIVVCLASWQKWLVKGKGEKASFTKFSKVLLMQRQLLPTLF